MYISSPIGLVARIGQHLGIPLSHSLLSLHKYSSLDSSFHLTILEGFYQANISKASFDLKYLEKGLFAFKRPQRQLRQYRRDFGKKMLI